MSDFFEAIVGSSARYYDVAFVLLAGKNEASLEGEVIQDLIEVFDSLLVERGSQVTLEANTHVHGARVTSSEIRMVWSKREVLESLMSSESSRERKLDDLQIRVFDDQIESSDLASQPVALMQVECPGICSYATHLLLIAREIVEGDSDEFSDKVRKFSSQTGAVFSARTRRSYWYRIEGQQAWMRCILELLGEEVYDALRGSVPLSVDELNESRLEADIDTGFVTEAWTAL